MLVIGRRPPVFEQRVAKDLLADTLHDQPLGLGRL
jgi:hypothetical protein